MTHDLHVHLKDKTITIGGTTIPYGAKSITNNISQVETLIVRNDHEKIVMAGEYIEVHSEELKSFDGEIALEPHTDSPLSGTLPPPTITRVVKGSV